MAKLTPYPLRDYSRITVTLLLTLLLHTGLAAQDCDPEVPHFNVDLSNDVDGIFYTPYTQRLGNCCGTVHPDKCVSFTITLHEDAVGILFDICDGAVPPGALYYQIDCGPQVQVGNVLCLDGPGPHQLTFCKPGNNQNVYCITSIPSPNPGPPQVASDGCTADIWAIGYDPTTINWTSVFPGAPGTYDNLMSCPTCETTTVTAPEDFPPYADFMICGQTIGGCAVTPDCDTVRVYFESSLAVEIAPEDPAICFGSTGTDVTAVGSGGFPPYTFTWSNGTVGETTWIDQPGTYTVQISDTSDCPPASYEFVVTEYDLPLTVDAGTDITVCTDAPSFDLNGMFSGIDESYWEGGEGVFSPDRYDPQATYTPTLEEITGGQIELILTLNPIGGCPSLSDTLFIQFAPFSATVTSNVVGIQCFGDDNGMIDVEVDGAWEPYSITWDDANLSGWSLENLTPGTYPATITNAVGCDLQVEFEVQEPTPLLLEINNVTDITCFGLQNGSAALTVSGGLPDYNFTWPNGASNTGSADNLPSGDYTIIVQDNNQCIDSVNFTISEPEPLTLTATADTLVCTGTATDLSAQASGGNGDYEYHWSHGLSNESEQTLSLQEDDEVSVFVTDQNGCSSDTLFIPIDVIGMEEYLLLPVSGPEVCQGMDTYVGAYYFGDHPPYTYNWSHNLSSTPGPHPVSPDETTTYSVVVSDICGNTVNGEIAIVIHPNPEIVVDSTTDISCFGANDGTAEVSVNNGTPDFDFNWSSDGNSGESATNLPPGYHQVTVSDTNGCTDQVDFTIVEPEPLTITADADTLICVGSTVSLNASVSGGTGNVVFHWNEGLPDAGTHEVVVTENTVFTVFTTDANGCHSDTLQLPVNVIEMDPDLLSTLSGDPVCQGGTTSVSAFYDGEHPPYYYSWSHGLPSTAGPHNVSPEESTTYMVIVSDDCGNEVSNEVEVIIWPLPHLSLQDQSDVSCFGMNDGTATVVAEGGTPEYTYTWSDEMDHQSYATDLTPGQHSVTVSDAHQCPDSLWFIIAEPEPLMLTANADSLVCPGDEVLLSAEASGGVGSYTLQWTPDLPDGSPQTIYPTEDVTVSVSATDNNDCTTESILLEIDVITMEVDLLEVIAGAPICPGASTTVFAEYDGAHPPYYYQWSHNLPNGPGAHSVQPPTSTTYTVNVTDRCDNQVQGNVEVEVLPQPVINIPDILGDGCADLEVYFTDTVNNPTTHTHVWTVNDQQVYYGETFHHIFSQPGVHTIDLSVTSFAGCTASSSSPSLVMVLPSPTAAFSADPWETGIDDPEITFTDQSSGDIDTWEWTFGDGTNSQFQHPIHVYPDTGTFAVQLLVENNVGCQDSLTRNILIYPVYDIIIPNAFTPTTNTNGMYDPTDTSNDVFYPFADYVEEFRMSIFNRWGELIFESLDINYGWNGFYRKEPCPQDVYVYKIEFKFSDGEEITRVGDITLFR